MSKPAWGSKGQITGVLDGQIVPVTDSPLLTSARTPWEGFLLEIYSGRVVREDVKWGWNKAHACLLTHGSIEARVHRSGGGENFLGKPGSCFVFPAGFDETRFTYADSDFRLICVQLDPESVSTLLKKPGPEADHAMLPQIASNDLPIAMLLRSMADEVAGGCPSGSLFSQSLSLALVTYLESRFSTNKPKRNANQHKLSSRHIRQLQEHIEENLGNELDLCDLAELVSVSPRHFYRLFSNTFGITPHRYISNQRVARAKALLLAGQTISKVAQELGFSNKSHFTSVFRKSTGAPPGRFRTELLNKLGSEVSEEDS